jgi:hypothetical protein
MGAKKTSNPRNASIDNKRPSGAASLVEPIRISSCRGKEKLQARSS